MIDIVTSKNDIAICLTDERWAHTTEEHNELAGMRLEVLETVADPMRVLAGGRGEILAVREIKAGRFLVVVYRETVYDGFIITAFVTSRTGYLNRREQLWP